MKMTIFFFYFQMEHILLYDYLTLVYYDLNALNGTEGSVCSLPAIVVVTDCIYYPCASRYTPVTVAQHAVAMPHFRSL